MTKQKIPAIFIILVLFLAIIYWPSFFSRFFQDDFLLLKLAKSGNVFTPIQNFPYRPLSIQIFYSLGLNLFGNNPVGFHLLTFAIFTSTLVFIYFLAKKILDQSYYALVVVFVYAFNVSLFPLFYWIATSYITLAAFFTFAGLHFYFKSGKKNFLITLILLFLGLLSNELLIVFPILAFLMDYLLKKFQWKKLAVLTLIVGTYFVIRHALIAGPTAKDYTLVFSPTSVFSTFRWYFLRIFNLPEGVRIGSNELIYGPFAVLAVITVWQSAMLIKQKVFPIKLFIFSLVWFFAGSLPFFFLPWHMSAYYLTLSLFGPGVFFAKIFSKNKAALIGFILAYIILTILGLQFLSQTHWIITKPTR